jgi:predicted nucleotidyltransferase
MLRKEADIMYFFACEPWKRYTFTELKVVSKKKSKSYLAMTIKSFLKRGILRQDFVGRLPVYSLNTGSAKARAFAGFVLENSAWGKKHMPYQDLEKLMRQVPVQNYAFIITGSYARGRQTEKSDVDAVILVDDAVEPKRVYAELSHACEMSIPHVHLYVFRNKEFMDMLLNREANYGKEIALNNMILYGGQVYLQLVAEAMRHGFTGKPAD